MLILANIVGFVSLYWRYFATGLAVLVLLVAVVFTYRSCSKPAKLDEAAIQKAQNAIAENDRRKMIEVLAEIDTKEAEIDSTLKQIEIDRERAKNDYMVNLKSELEIRMLHEKIDHLILSQQQEVLEVHKEQMEILINVIKRLDKLDDKK